MLEQAGHDGFGSERGGMWNEPGKKRHRGDCPEVLTLVRFHVVPALRAE